MAKRTLKALALILLFPAILLAQANKSTGELDKIRSDIADFQKMLRNESMKEKSILQNIQETEHQIQLGRGLIDKIKKEERNTNSRISTNRKKLTTAQSNIAELKKIYSGRAVSIYKNRNRSVMEYFLNKGSVKGSAALAKYFSILSARDEKLVSDIKARADNLTKTNTSLLNDIEKKRKLKNEKQKQTARLKGKQSQSEKMLDTVRDDKKRIQYAIEDRKKAEKEVLSLLSKMNDSSPTPNIEKILAGLPKFASFKGGLPWPVKGTLVSRAGLERDPATKVKILNKGLEILTEYGEDIHAVGKGRVAKIKWLPWYGQTIFIQHSNNFYTVYARFSEITVDINDVVDAGQIIGKAGYEAATTDAKMNFQIWKGAENLNPEEWLTPLSKTKIIVDGFLKKNLPKN